MVAFYTTRCISNLPWFTGTFNSYNIVIVFCLLVIKKKMKFKKLGVLPKITEPESVRNSDMNQVLADINVLILHAALDLVNLFREGLPSKIKHPIMRTSCVITAQGACSHVGVSIC